MNGCAAALVLQVSPPCGTERLSWCRNAFSSAMRFVNVPESFGEARKQSLMAPVRARGVPLNASSGRSRASPKRSVLKRGQRTAIIRSAGSAASSFSVRARVRSLTVGGAPVPLVNSPFVELCHSPHAPAKPASRNAIVSALARSTGVS